jgi:methionine-gamma-lyase
MRKYKLIMSTTKPSFSFETLCIHGGFTPEQHNAHLTPIYASSTYLFDSAQHAVNLFTGQEQGYIYGRFGNPTTEQTEAKIALLETNLLTNKDGEQLQAKAILHASGMAAFTTLFLSQLQQGDKIISHYSLYGGTQEMMDKILPLCGVEIILIDMKNLDLVEKTMQANPNIKLMHLETPANPTIQCVDIEALTKIAHQYKAKVSVDNTFATPYLQQPFAFGVDFIVHSTTKFLNGHGTAIGGVLLGTDLHLMQTKVTKHFRLLGGNSNAFDAFLLNNGIKTLALRMDKHCSNAEKVANFLNQHPKVAFVNYLGLPSHPDYAIAQKQMKHAGALLSFELKGGLTAGIQFLEAVKICTHAVSLGTCDTLVSHPASTTHTGVDKEHRLKSGITDGLIRMSVGIEAIDDLLTDLTQALDQC